jgi:hypothetical protein
MAQRFDQRGAQPPGQNVAPIFAGTAVQRRIRWTTQPFRFLNRLRINRLEAVDLKLEFAQVGSVVAALYRPVVGAVL